MEQVIRENPKGNSFKFKSYDNLLFYTLFVLKTGVTFDQAGFIFQFDLANAKRNFNTGLNILHLSLYNKNILPIREFDNRNDFESYFDKTTDLLIDGTEQRIQRPIDYVAQKEHYSGKKKTHTHKCLIISTLDTYIHFVSHVYSGKEHDFSILKQEFDPKENWFAGYTVRMDLGYQGFYNEYPNASIFLPHKKRKKIELTAEQKLNNKVLASKRIFVEHSIGGMKRYELVSGQSRIHDESIYDQIVVTCAGLWNFFITS